MDGWPTDAYNPQESTSSTSISQIIFQLNQLYVILQKLAPEWSQQNPFWPMVNGSDDGQLRELHANWTQWLEYAQPQSRVDVLMR